ncbi:hypothetical protein KBD61_05380 [Patescibacteria group bacterium]|nr:hypothetical protein [Patescibacteria group bacterium]MBP9710422.1 hypothetical protein [Patescibacteria group bacterium]
MRAYFRVTGLTLRQDKCAGWQLIVQRAGQEVKIGVGQNSGEFFMELDDARPTLPPELQTKVVSVTRLEFVEGSSPTRPNLRLGRFRSLSAAAQVEITDYSVSSRPGGCKLVYSARNVTALKLFRDRILGGEFARCVVLFEPAKD